MATVLIFSILLQSLLYASCSGRDCSEDWSTGITKYRVVKHNGDSYVYASCKYPNYKLDGEKTNKCIDGLLPEYLPRCVHSTASCLYLKAPTFGSMKCSDTTPEVGSRCSFECQNTHYLRGTVTRICSEDLRWTGIAARCFLKTECPVPPPLHQGTVSGCSPERKPRYNDTCYFRCNEGFRLKGPSQLKCRLDGRLTDGNGQEVFPRCEPPGSTHPSVSPTRRHGNFQSTTRPFSPTSLMSCHVQNGYCSHDCHQESKGVRCSCRSGYRLSQDGRTCREIHPYPSRPTNRGKEDFRTANLPVSPPSWLSCQLHKGYCNHNCHQEAEGIQCSCRSGYRLSQDGRTCKDVDECKSERLNKCDHLCQNTDGSYECLCSEGYTSPDGFRCEKTLPSLAIIPSPPSFPPAHLFSCERDNGHCSHLCHQEPEGVRCSCRNGYRLAPDGRYCDDIDECRDEGRNKCDHFCRNTVGSFTCSCRQGYSSPDGFRCEDVDECSDDSLNKCDHTCKNTDGGYICSCRAGFVSSDGFRCEGCRANSYRTMNDVSCQECPANAHTEGGEKTSINHCICNPGFTGNPAQGIPCEDTDECADGASFGCSHVCLNTPGSALCTCPLGYQLKRDAKTCIDIDECSIKNGGCDGICHNTIGNFTCSCPNGYVASTEDKYSCDDVDECAEENGGCSGECVNFKGGFHCFCSEGYHLHPDGKSCIPIRCPRVSVPHHSSLRCKNSSDSKVKKTYRLGEMPEDEEFPVGATCRIKCDRGYEVRDSQPGIVCQNDGKWNASLPDCRVLQCPPLSPPSNGDVYPPSCKKGLPVKQKCFFTCKPGYRITGQEVLSCRNNLTWSKKKPTLCVPETEVSISCPDDDITIELMPDEGWAEILLNSPRTSITAGPIQVRPEWVNLDRTSIFPAGETEVTFSVTGGNKTAECSISVIVLDKYPPVFPDCPDTLFVSSGLRGTAVDWEEPVPQDNVGIASVSKSLEPNSFLNPGFHFVEYMARDFAGNVGQCIFYINVTAGGCKDLADPENGEANCQEWMFGKICQPTCFDNYTRPSEFFACDESGTWTPSDFISPCLAECLEDEIWFPELQTCVKLS